jgi:hypothetical protein
LHPLYVAKNEASDAWFEETKNARGGSMMASAPRILFRAIAPRSSKTAAPPFYSVQEFGGWTDWEPAEIAPIAVPRQISDEVTETLDYVQLRTRPFTAGVPVQAIGN